MNDEPIFIATGADTPRDDLPFVEREAITAVVRDPKTNKFVGLRWKKIDWETFITGGVEEGQSAEDAARAEVYEESGYRDLTLVKELPRYHAKFYHGPKGENRFAHFHNFFFELKSDERDTINDEELEKHDCVWLTRDELGKFALPEGHRWLLEYI